MLSISFWCRWSEGGTKAGKSLLRRKLFRSRKLKHDHLQGTKQAAALIQHQKAKLLPCSWMLSTTRSTKRSIWYRRVHFRISHPIHGPMHQVGMKNECGYVGVGDCAPYACVCHDRFPICEFSPLGNCAISSGHFTFHIVCLVGFKHAEFCPVKRWLLKMVGCPQEILKSYLRVEFDSTLQ